MRMYIEDNSKPFLVLENQNLRKEEFLNSRKTAYQYFFLGRTKKIVGICFAVTAVLFFLQLTAGLILHRITVFPIFSVLTVVLLSLFAVLLLMILPENFEERGKIIYESSPFIKEKSTISFYKEFYEIKNKNEYFKVYRADVVNCLENGAFFILKKKDNTITVIKKDSCTQEEITVLRDYLKETYVNKFIQVK